LALVLALGGLGLPAAAQEKFPTRAVQMVSPFPPGGTVDLHARAIAPILERYLKQPVVVVTKTGAAGAVGIQYVAVSKPDGYTILMGLPSVSILPQVDHLFGRPPAFTKDQLAPIALLSADPAVLVVRAQSPFKTVADMVAEAKRRPNQLTHGSGGVYAVSHLPMEMLKHAAGDIQMRHVPFTGGGPAMTALLGGHIDTLVTAVSVAVPQAKAGAIRVLGSWGARRVAALPNVPPLKELGYDVEFYLWVGMLAPKATPAPAMRVLREAVRQTVNDADFKAGMAKLETPIEYLDGDDFQRWWDREYKAIGDAIARVGKVEVK
jgi:tripartite-type tricarboxylate transporter receptor subunit TctC